VLIIPISFQLLLCPTKLRISRFSPSTKPIEFIIKSDFDIGDSTFFGWSKNKNKMGGEHKAV
jgi:hypothetical protein